MTPSHFILTDVFICQLKSLGPADFAHPLRRSNSKLNAAEEVVHSSGKEEMAGDTDDTACTTKEKVIPKKRGGSGKLMVVAGNLLIPAISKLNAGWSWKHHPRIPLPSICQSQGNLSIYFFIVAAFHY
jgi:hypothetical protein